MEVITLPKQENNYLAIPETLEEASAQQLKRDYHMFENMIRCIERERKLPIKKQDTFYLRSICYTLTRLYEYDHAREEDQRQYPALSDELYQYIKTQGELHSGFRDKVSDKKDRKLKYGTPTVLRNILIILSVSIALVFSAQGIAYAFGFDLFKNFSDWGKSILSLPKNTEISQKTSQQDVIVFPPEEAVIYKNIEDIIVNIDGKLLYPDYLPGEIYITEILFINEDNQSIMYFHFNDSFYNLNFRVELSSDIKDKFSIEWNETENYSQFICKVNDIYQADFTDSKHTYSIACNDYDILLKIVENLQYY